MLDRPRYTALSANLRGAVTIGPNCRIGGEVEASIVHGFSNKYHEGFLGHAYVGEWVNLGAITSNSDLRNDYGEVFVPLQGDPIATGQAKVGCFIGDHTRTGMGSMLNTGTSIGVMCNVLPAGILCPSMFLRSRAVSYGRVAPGFPLDRIFETARTVVGRRGKIFGEAMSSFTEFFLSKPGWSVNGASALGEPAQRLLAHRTRSGTMKCFDERPAIPRCPRGKPLAGPQGNTGHGRHARTGC